MRIADLPGPSVGVVGYGQEGRASYTRLKRLRPDLDCTVYSEHPLSGKKPDCPVVIGPLEGEVLGRHPVLIKSPGISLYRPELDRARELGARLTSASALWFAEPRAFPVVAVTGSKGKSTTCALIQFLLQQAGLDAPLAGNYGVPLLSLWDLSPDAVVVELSSYQCADFAGRPEVAVLTNLFPEHLDWHGSLDRYLHDKLKIFAQRPPVCLVNAQDAESMQRTADLPGRTVFAHPEGWEVLSSEVRYQGEHVASPPAWTLPGRHNRTNLAAALAAVHALALDPWPGLSRLEHFKALPHRLEKVGTRNGVMIVDDSIATAPEATAAALEALAGPPLALIVGGYDRGLDWAHVARQLRDQPVSLVLALGQSGPRIAETLARVAPSQPVQEVEDLAAAVKAGLTQLEGRGVLLLSPGAPSYDQYADYRERGQRFRALALQG